MAEESSESGSRGGDDDDGVIQRQDSVPLDAFEASSAEDSGVAGGDEYDSWDGDEAPRYILHLIR